MPKICYIMRGVPGSGKSNKVQEICDEAIADGRSVKVCSADHYFMNLVDPNDPTKGESYQFDPNKLGVAHAVCRSRATKGIEDGIDVVVIDNTNTTAKEVLTYAEIAACGDYEVKLVEPSSPWWHAVSEVLKGKRLESRLKPHAAVFAEKNIHGVPEHAIMRMLMRWENTTDLIGLLP